MAQDLNLALAQVQPKLGDPEANLQTMSEILAAHPEADLAIFPELFLGGYATSDISGSAIKLDRAALLRVSELARDSATAVVFGATERTPGGYANSAICVDERGEFTGVYRKTHLFAAEREAFVAGDELLLVEIKGVKLGLMICFDVEFPEIARALARAGADLLVTISANMHPYGPDHHVFARARALENGLPHAYVNQTGAGEEFVFTGETALVSADGKTLASAGETEEETLQLTLGLPARSSTRADYLAQLRSPLPGVNVCAGSSCTSPS